MNRGVKEGYACLWVLCYLCAHTQEGVCVTYWGRDRGKPELGRSPWKVGEGKAAVAAKLRHTVPHHGLQRAPSARSDSLPFEAGRRKSIHLEDKESCNPLPSGLGHARTKWTTRSA